MQHTLLQHGERLLTCSFSTLLISGCTNQALLEGNTNEENSISRGVGWWGFRNSESTPTRSVRLSYTLPPCVPHSCSSESNNLKLHRPCTVWPLEVAVHQKSATHTTHTQVKKSVCACVCACVWDKWDHHRRKRLSPHLDVYLSCQLVSTKDAHSRLLGSGWRGETAAARCFIFTSTPPRGGGGKVSHPTAGSARKKKGSVTRLALILSGPHEHRKKPQPWWEIKVNVKLWSCCCNIRTATCTFIHYLWQWA